jgi:hypothetical protein
MGSAKVHYWTTSKKGLRKKCVNPEHEHPLFLLAGRRDVVERECVDFHDKWSWCEAPTPAMKIGQISLPTADCLLPTIFTINVGVVLFSR